MCLIVDWQSDAYSPPLRVDGPQSQAAEGEDAASRPVDEIWSFIESARLTFIEEGAERPAQDENILWCAAGDGTRCVPEQSMPTAPELVPPPPAVQSSFVFPRAATERVAHPRPTSEIGPSGFSERLLRPPR